MAAFILRAAMGGGIPGGAGNPLPTIDLSGVFDACRTKPEAPDNKFVNAPPPQEGPLYLRMLFLSGSDLPAGDITGTSDPYVDVRFGGQVFCSPPQMSTLNPVWDYLLETEVKEPGVMRVTVYDQDFGRQGDRLGDCEIQIPKTPMKIKKETVSLHHVLSSFLKKPPNSRITILYHIVDRLDDQPDLLEMSKQIGEAGGEAATPQDYTVRVNILESGHPSVRADMLSAIRVSVGDKSQVTGLGRPEGLRYAYGPRGMGSQLDFFLYNSTLEDLIQNRLRLEWILRRGTEDELDAAKSLYVRRAAQDEASVPKATVTLDIQDAADAAVAQDRRSFEKLASRSAAEEARGGGDEERQEEAGDGEHFARAQVGSGAEVAAPDASVEKDDDAELKGEKRQEQGSSRKKAKFEAVPTREAETSLPDKKTKVTDDFAARRRGKERRRARAKHPEAHFLTFGTWEFPLDDVREFCVEKRVCAWAARATLLNAAGMKVGEVLLDVDIFTSKEARRQLIDLYHFPPPVQHGLELPPPKLSQKKLQPSTERARYVAAEAQEAAQHAEAASKTEEGKSKQKVHAPVRRPKDRDGTYYVYLYSDFLPKTDANYNSCQWDNCDPFVTVSSPNAFVEPKTWSTTVKSNRQRECLWDPLPIQMPKNPRRQKLVLDVFDSDAPFASTLLKEQVGTARLLRVSLNRPVWLHMYGGNFEGTRSEYNVMMLRGGLDPPSTYHGSLCVLVDSKRTRRHDWPPFPDKVGLPVRIEVKLARALYLPDMYREREVSILVQVAGCLLELPDDDDPQQRKKMGFLQQYSTRRRTLTRDLEGIRSIRSMEELPDSNFDILEFPGYVDARGVLRLYNWGKSRAEMTHDTVEAYRRAARGLDGEEAGEGGEEPLGLDSRAARSESEREGDVRLPQSRLEQDLDYPESLLNAWVKRVSEPVYLLPRVQWAYLYIVAVGEEQQPPRLFARLPLHGGSHQATQFIEGTVGPAGGDDGWPPPQALLKAKRRSQAGGGACADEDVRRAFDSPGERRPGIEPLPPHPAVLLRDKGTAALGDGSSTLRERENAAVDTQSQSKFKWTQIHWDQSVTALPACRFPSSFAGCLLGHACAVVTEDPARFPSLRSVPADEAPAPLRQLNLRETAQEVVMYDEEPLEAVPRPEEVSVMCGFERVTHRQGHIGWRVEYESLLSPRSVAAASPPPPLASFLGDVSPFYRQVYFHCDMLQARNLPAMDADASVNPWWSIEVETEVVKYVQERDIGRDMKILGSTANPSFLARTAVPVFLYIAPAMDPKALAMGAEETQGGETAAQSVSGSSGRRPKGVRKPPPGVDGRGLQRAGPAPSVCPEARSGLPDFGSLLLPPPPIVTRIFDIDIGDKGEIEKEMISVVVDWDPANMDERQRTFGDLLRRQEARQLKLRQRQARRKAGVADLTNGDSHSAATHAADDPARALSVSAAESRPAAAVETDPNFANEAVWYALQGNEQLSFDAVERSFSLGVAWQKRPRLLASVGFSAGGCSALANNLIVQAEQRWLASLSAVSRGPAYAAGRQGCACATPEWLVYRLTDPAAVREDKGCHLLYYQIDIDLLGLRMLKTAGLEPSADYILKLSSFWPEDPECPLEFPLAPDDFPGPNIVAQFADHLLRQKLRRRVVYIPDAETCRNSKQVALPLRKTPGSTGVPGKWVGARVSPPLFVTPYLPYLQSILTEQQLVEEATLYAQSAAGAEGLLAHVQSRPWAVRSILPDINFRLRSREGGDVASLGLSVNEYLRLPQGDRALQCQLLSPQLAKLPAPKLHRDLMEQYLIPELPCTNVANVDVLVECFADATGDLLYDDDLLVGRLLTDHDMFFIRELNTNEILVHTLNADDYFVGCPDKVNVPFEEPVLKVGDLSDPGPTAAEYDEMMSALKREKEESRPFFAALTKRRTAKVHPSESLQSSTSEDAADQQRVRAALRTWLRKPGHKTNLEQRGSCLLARLQIMKTVYKTGGRRKTRRATAALLQDTSFDREFFGTYNMINIYTNEEGVVVWTHDEKDEGSKEKLFGQAGELLMVFLSLPDKKFHRISVPSFDIRYPAENDFVIVDTITENILDLSKMALEQKLARMAAQMKLLKRHSAKEESDEGDALSVEIQELQIAIDKLVPLTGGYLKSHDRKAGFATPLEVRRGQLVCRLKKRGLFDRNQTQIWFDNFNVLPANNITSYLEWGEEKKKVAQLKGWLKVTDVTEQREAALAQGARSQRSSSASLSALESLLRPEASGGAGGRGTPSGRVRSDGEAKRPGMSGAQAGDPTLDTGEEAEGHEPCRLGAARGGEKAKSGTSPPAESESSVSTRCSLETEERRTPRVTLAPPMQRWVVETVVVHVYVLTGRSLLNVDWFGKSDPYLRLCLADQTVVSDNVFSNNDSPDFYEHFVFSVLIPGAAKLRITVMDKGDMLAADSPIGEATLDLEERPVTWKDKETFLPPLQTFPIEYLTLDKSSEEDDQGISCGTLRCLVDMVADGSPYDPLPVNNLAVTQEFELRVVIWDVTDISVFKGASGERNDVKVRVELYMTGIDLQDTYEVYYTDVHLFAKTTATFNWRIVKQISLPLAALSLKFTIVDNNAVFDDDALYAPESLSLEALTHTTMARLRADESLLDPLDYTIAFDEPMGQGMTTAAPAHLHCTVSLVPKDVAERHPAGQGRAGPDALPEPTDRPSPNLMFTDPVAYLNLVIGEQTCALIKASSACFCGILVLGIIAFVIALVVIAVRMP
ncbi:C2 domain-containing protein [Besnoitia besnoiti]|uniref:C2 domain-containing protein n=1 Tax=Besnoitia besnoiti TaxID=94643 RepID=A0A2A9M146_BESBE|nr:C2 domain-containing protein [Besnoitia besnoiti]PFH31705.1 C2 domain-containing protein [Besnoitia besnoiti]